MIYTGTDILIKINSTLLCYDDAGTGNIPLIFIHGFPFDKFSWKPQQVYLGKYTRVISYDIRGYGKSVAGEEDFSIQLFADDLILLMDALQINKANICGLSMGGYIALNAVSRYQERFNKLILCGTQCNADSAEGKEKRFKTIKMIEDGGYKEWVDLTTKNVFASQTHESKKDVVEAIRKRVHATSQESVTRTLRALAERTETCFYLPEINVPVLIISGADDKVIPPAQSEFMHKQIPHSEYRTIEYASHLSNLDNPEKFNELIKNFIMK